MGNNIFLEKQNQLQKQASEVLNNLDLIKELSKFGEVKVVGSVSLGLMTWPDIDIDLKNNTELNEKDKNLKPADFLFSLKYDNMFLLWIGQKYTKNTKGFGWHWQMMKLPCWVLVKP